MKNSFLEYIKENRTEIYQMHLELDNVGKLYKKMKDALDKAYECQRKKIVERHGRKIYKWKNGELYLNENELKEFKDMLKRSKKK